MFATFDAPGCALRCSRHFHGQCRQLQTPNIVSSKVCTGSLQPRRCRLVDQLRSVNLLPQLSLPGGCVGDGLRVAVDVGLQRRPPLHQLFELGFGSGKLGRHLGQPARADAQSAHPLAVSLLRRIGIADLRPQPLAGVSPSIAFGAGRAHGLDLRFERVHLEPQNNGGLLCLKPCLLQSLKFSPPIHLGAYELGHLDVMLHPRETPPLACSRRTLLCVGAPPLDFGEPLEHHFHRAAFVGVVTVL
mmetsp:Transcript_5689/g.17134  ORF Transcript_5689/g.17134 Transcript_5689/m.17134 type:complete len:245 (+) Transcript_5689:298-1032(+)